MRWPVAESTEGLWLPWFAWRPVRVNGEWVWLETVLRRWRGACDWYVNEYDNLPGREAR